jgi:3,4-dihydroxy 2-butanone 4-phosphate synthase/GTP cyclohydrolase II
MGANQLRLITNNPAKYGGIEGYGLEIIERVAINPVATEENIKYLQTKRDRMGHLFSLPESDSE